jgi:hypothetical protein
MKVLADQALGLVDLFGHRAEHACKDSRITVGAPSKRLVSIWCICCKVSRRLTNACKVATSSRGAPKAGAGAHGRTGRYAPRRLCRSWCVPTRTWKTRA